MLSWGEDPQNADPLSKTEAQVLLSQVARNVRVARRFPAETEINTRVVWCCIYVFVNTTDAVGVQGFDIDLSAV